METKLPNFEACWVFYPKPESSFLIKALFLYLIEPNQGLKSASEAHEMKKIDISRPLLLTDNLLEDIVP